jgi:tripartite ATP-independent transporter DctP family solute receptor
MIKRIAFSLAVMAVSATTIAEDKLSMSFGHTAPPGSLKGLSAAEFTKRVNAQVGERIDLQLFPAGQLGNDRSMLQRLKLGSLTFQLPSSVMSSVSPEFGVFDMPYLIKDRDHMKRITGDVLPILEEAAEKRGYKILAVWENGFRQITNNKRAIVSPEDLGGIKLRTPKGKWRLKMFSNYGANPTPMALSEVFTALQTGVIDGQENPLSIINSSKFSEVQQYLSITNHVYTPAYVLVGKKSWEKLPKDVQADIEHIAQDMQGWVYEKGKYLDETLQKELGDQGMKINKINRNEFIKQSQTVYNEFKNSVDGMDKIISIIQEKENN